MSQRSIVRWLSSIVILYLSCLPVLVGAAETAKPPSASHPIYVVLWFDTEDYILPASDDAALRIANLLSAEGVKATFKVVGEKARVLESRGRQDVIAAIRRHEIGYHSNLHSQHPTPAERLSRMDWDEGIQEFERTERQGFEDVKRIFGKVPICYGQPGASWAAQSYPTLKRWGVPLYLDESDHVGIDNQPFWYGGLLNVLKMREYFTRVELQQDSDLAKAKSTFQSLQEKLQTRGGGLLSVCYHPCEFVHQQFWDAVNFSRGMNPARPFWKQPPVKSAGEIEQGFKNFQAYVSFLKNTPGVEFLTGSDLLRLYQDKAATRAFSTDEILVLSRAVQKEITFWKGTDFTVSPAESFVLLNSTLARFLENQRVPSGVQLEFVYGPTRSIERTASSATIGWSDFAAACLDVQAVLRKDRHIPNEIWIGSRALSPVDYLATLGRAVEEVVLSGRAKDSVVFLEGNLTVDRYVAEDSPKIWGWLVFPEGFHSPKIMELAKQQAWTLKPAVLKSNSAK